MKLTAILLLTACIHVSARGFAQKITLSEKNISLAKVFKKISAQSNYLFFYDQDLLKNAQPIDIHVMDADLDEVLAICLRNQRLAYTITNKIIVIKPKEEIGDVVAPPAPVFLDIRGIVRDENGKPLAGASVKLKGSERGTSTDADGSFSLQVPNGGGMLVISYVGYQTVEVPASGTINVQLQLDENKIENAVVIGYGTQRKRDVTGSLSTVTAKDFQDAPVVRLDQALQGRSTGVQVTTSSGSPGGNVRIRIRGANSLTGDNSPLYVVDGFVGADFTTLNTDDIASIEILKDASATAIYGSRGANGVVIVTTRTGTKGKMAIDVTSKYYSASVIKRYPIMNAADFAKTVNARYAVLTPAAPPRFTDDQIAQFQKTGGTNWQDEIFRTAPGQEHQLTFSGGSDKTSFLVSANYLNQKGVIDNSDYTRYSLRTNLTSQLLKNLSFRLNFAGVRNENHNTSGTNGRGGSLGQALAWAPTTPVYDGNGNYILHDPTSSIFQNPVALNNETDNRTNNTNMNLISGLRYQFIRDLTLDVQFGLNYNNSQGMGFAGPDITSNVPTASRSSNENVLWQSTSNLTYKHVFNHDHSLEITGVYETQKFSGTGFNVGVSNLTYPAQSYNNIALSASSNVGSGYSEWALLSMLGRVNYAYKDKYLVSASVRRDGSSKFQGSNKYSTFPSAALGWRVTEEPFMQDQHIFHNLKLRASWGLTGNQGINPYGTLSAYVTDLDDAGSIFAPGPGSTIVSGIILGNPGNPDLKWETTEQKNAGIDMDFFGGMLSASVDYFVKNTRNLLLSQPIPGYLGGYSILSNIGRMDNKGWEFSVNVNAITLKDFSWSSSANISLLRNKLVSLGAGKPFIEIDPFILQPGSPIGTFYGYKYLGTWKTHDATEAAKYGAHPGDARYYDKNGDGVINTDDFVQIGNSMPRTSLGWNNTFTYKNFSMNVFFEGLLGMDKLNYSYAFGMLGSTDAKEILFSDIKNRYIPGTNETSNIPAFSAYPGNAYTQSSRFVESAAFVRLKNLSAAYTFPKKKFNDILSIKVFVSATNLITFTHYRGIDPESNSSAPEGNINGYEADTQQGVDQGAYPNSVMWTFGVNVHF
ncbi:MAG TPA: TonB-dependent receptor [Puia sp.]|nr:TonB-dependent receptor [Puia sp.]